MTPLHLSPFPSLRTDEIPGTRITEREGFVDDEVVMALVAGPATQRNTPISAELALAVDDMDFAGWCLTPAPPVSRDKPTPQFSSPVVSQPQSRPAPPIQNEPGLDAPHSGSHRWWLAGLAGALSTLLFSLLLLSLSSRPISEDPDHFIIKSFAKPRPSAAIEMAAPTNPTPQLTDIVR